MAKSAGGLLIRPSEEARESRLGLRHGEVSGAADANMYQHDAALFEGVAGPPCPGTRRTIYMTYPDAAACILHLATGEFDATFGRATPGGASAS